MPAPILTKEPLPEMDPPKVKSSERLKASMPLSTISPTILPLVPPLPTCKVVPELIVVDPVYVLVPVSIVVPDPLRLVDRLPPICVANTYPESVWLKLTAEVLPRPPVMVAVLTIPAAPPVPMLSTPDDPVASPRRMLLALTTAPLLTVSVPLPLPPTVNWPALLQSEFAPL